MENWFRVVGRPALFEALAAACDRVGDDFENNITPSVRENTRLQAELEPLKSKAADVERLQEENRLLREEIQSLKSSNVKSSPREHTPTNQESATTPFARPSTRTPLAPISANETTPLKKPSKHERSDIDKWKTPELRDEFSRLEGNYNKLYEKYQEALDARTELDHRLREKIKNVEQWMNHANELNTQSQKRLRKVKRLEALLASLGENTAGLTASFSSDLSDNIPTTAGRKLQTPPPKAANRTHDRSAGIQSATDVKDFDRNPTKASTEQIPFLNRQDTGQKSLGGDSTQVSTRENSREPEAPSLPPLPKHQDNPQDVVTVKQEPSSDSPVVVSERSVRKRKREDDETGYVPATTRVKTEDDSDPVVFEERRRHFAPQDSMDFDAEIPHVQTPRKNRTRPFEVDGTTEKERTAVKSTTLLPADRSSALWPLDEDILPQRVGRNSKASSAGPASIRHGLSSLAEDDDQYRASRTARSLSIGRRSSKILNGLLNSPSAAPLSAGQPEDTLTSEPTQASEDFYFPIPPKRVLPFSKDAQRKASEDQQQAQSPAPTTSKRSTAAKQANRGLGGDSKAMSPPPPPHASTNRSNNNNNTTATTTTSSGPTNDRMLLRERGLSQLRLDDFKVNPAANEGLEYAFTDVVRNQRERQHGLSGCVRESCCGKEFRTLARAERPLTGPFAFQALLEQYLGDDAWRLAQMASPEKEALWVEAKTRELADTHGRCRHRYQRMASPPGFWRTDMPSTQEAQEDRARGRRMEAEMIQERYREAMRPGGKWLFRDE